MPADPEQLHMVATTHPSTGQALRCVGIYNDIDDANKLVRQVNDEMGVPARVFELPVGVPLIGVDQQMLTTTRSSWDHLTLCAPQGITLH